MSSAVCQNVHIVHFDLTVSLIWTSLSSKDHNNFVKTRRGFLCLFLVVMSPVGRKTLISPSQSVCSVA